MVIFILVMLTALGFPSIGIAGDSHSTPGSIAVAADRITYFARGGDTLASISQRFTDKPVNWTVLARLNNIDKDVRIPVGTAIVIPATLLSDDKVDARIVAFAGEVIVTTAEGRNVELKIGAPVSEGARVDTARNSFLTIALADDSRLSLPSNSQVVLTKLRQTRHTKSPRTEVTLLRGRVESRVAPLRHKGGSYDVRTPLSNAGVRGTHFRVGLNDALVTNEVISGTVDIMPSRGGPPVRLYSGMGNVVKTGGTGTPTSLPSAPALHELAMLPAESAVMLSLRSSQSASAYHVQISRDSDGQDVVREAIASGTRIRIDGLAIGDYYARVSTINPDGLEGGTQTHAFRLDVVEAAIAAPTGHAPKPPGAPRIELAKDGRLHLNWPGAPGQTYQVHIAHDPAFSWLLVNTKAAVPNLVVPRPSFGTYYARVQAVSAGGVASPFSLAQGFVVTDHWVLQEGRPAAVVNDASRASH